ncbi:MAG: Y-family DNA polymerase [Spirochaetota bacterium]
MVRLASISLPRFDLQILAQRYPDWKEHPCGVVSEEKPLGRILEVNRAARSDGVRPGMRYASALAICPLLRVGVISDADRVGQSRIVMSILKEFSPEVEQSQHDAGLFWVDASGMERLFATTAKWAGALQIAVTERGFVCSVAVGFSRFGTYAAAKVKRAVTLFESEDQERAAALRAPVGVLPLDHETLLRFHQLGLYTIKDFVRFSAGALARRFGREVAELHSFASGLKAMPIQSSPEPDPLSREMRLLYPQAASEALVHHLSSLLHELVAQAWKRQELVSEITLTMHPESWPGSADDSVEEHLQVAQPTADHVRLERLLRLRLESLELPGPVVRLAVAISCVGSDREQSELFGVARAPEYQKAMAAVAEITAELGNDGVQIAVLDNAHLPEEQFHWEAVERLTPPRLGDSSSVGAANDEGRGGVGAADLSAALVRRILHEPVSLGEIPAEFAAPERCGPYEVSGGWWATPYRREYYYLYDTSGRLLWIFFDVVERTWMVQGIVE